MSILDSDGHLTSGMMGEPPILDDDTHMVRTLKPNEVAVDRDLVLRLHAHLNNKLTGWWGISKDDRYINKLRSFVDGLQAALDGGR